MADKYQAIRDALALGPTPGPWYVGVQNDYLYVIDRPPRPSNDYPNHQADTALVAKPFAARGASLEANAAFIAACDPETIRALLAENAALRKALQVLLANFESQHKLLLTLGAPEFVAMRAQAIAALNMPNSDQK